MSGIKLPAIERPNGELYRPRKITPVTLGNEDELTGIVIFGSHDKRFAELRAVEHLREVADEFYGTDYTLDIQGAGELVWYRERLAGFDDDRPVYCYEHDPGRGRAGVKFDIEETEATK